MSADDRSKDDVVMVAPYPSVRDPSGSTSSIAAFSGVAGYSQRLTTALAAEGVSVRVLAPEVVGEPAVARVGGVTVERRYRRGTTALVVAARAAGRSTAPIVHVQHETFLFGGPSSIPGVVPALASLRARRRGPVVTLHQVVDPAVVDRDFTRLHRVQVPPWVARLGLSGIQRSIRTLSAATVVLERALTRTVPEAVVVHHGIDVPDAPRGDGLMAKQKLGLHRDRLTVLCFGFLSPYKGLESALEAAALAGQSVELVVAGGTHPRMTGDGAYGDDLRRRFGDVARFTGYVAEPDVPTYFQAADVLLLPYLAPFGTSGPFAHALGHGTPVLCSEALARCMGAPPELVVPVEPEGLATRLVELATDRRALRAVGAATRELADGRTWQDVARNHVALYEEVINAVALLAGAFGQGNLGDDALQDAFVRALPDWRITVTTDDPASAEGSGCTPVSPRRRAQVARAAASADAVVVGGGTIFKSLHPASRRHPHALLANASVLVGISSALHRPVALVGVGAGVLTDQRARTLARFIVRHSDLLILRDEESAAELIGAGTPGPFRVGADPTWTLLEPPDARGAHDASVRIVPSIYAVGPDGLGGMVERLSGTVRRVLADGCKVQLQVWERPPGARRIDDGDIVDTLVSRFGPSVEVVPTPDSFVQAVHSMQGCGSVLSFRFHALVAAAAAGVPAVAVTHESKLGAMARRLEQRSVPADFGPGDLADLVEEAVRAPGPAPAVIKDQIAMAEEGFRLMRVLLSGGRSHEADSLGALPLVPSPLSP